MSISSLIGATKLCDLCGCAAATDHVHVDGAPLTGTRTRAASGRRIEVMQSLLRDNDHQAAHNRSHFAATGTLVVNLMSSPGAGKTSLLETTIRALAILPSESRLAVAVIEGDLETENDARRIRALGTPAVQITTGNACHLDAAMVHAALHSLDLMSIDVLFIENVGNLVCPAGFDLGQHCNVVLLSVTEGDDKPEKYPVMFRAANLLAVTKTDLLSVVDDFAPARVEGHLRALASAAPVLELSARSGAGMAGWIGWLINQRAQVARSTIAAHG